MDKNIFINSYIIKILSIINFEEKLKENIGYKFPTCNSNNFSKTLRGIYSSYLSFFRYIITPNFKTFNNIFKIEKNSYAKRYKIEFQDKESYTIFKNLLCDYIAEKTNICYNDNNDNDNKENIRSKMLQILNEKIPEENLKNFGKILKENKSFNDYNNNINKIFFIERRNLQQFNFFINENNKKLEKFNILLQNISKEILEKVQGKIIQKEFFNILNNSNFTFILEEINEYSTKDSFAYINNNDSILVLFNCKDHIQIILNPQKFEELAFEYKDYQIILDILKPFVIFDDFFGYLTTNPLNSGSSFEIRVNLNNNINNKERKLYEEIKPLIRELGLNRSPNFINNFDVYNKIKANFTRKEIIEKFEKFVERLNFNFSKKDNNISKEIKEIEEEVNTEK